MQIDSFCFNSILVTFTDRKGKAFLIRTRLDKPHEGSKIHFRQFSKFSLSTKFPSGEGTIHTKADDVGRKIEDTTASCHAPNNYSL